MFNEVSYRSSCVHRFKTCVPRRFFHSPSQMASQKSVSSFNWLEYLARHRRACIAGGLAVAGVGAAAVALHLLGRPSRNVAYSRTAEIACLLRFVCVLFACVSPLLSPSAPNASFACFCGRVRARS